MKTIPTIVLVVFVWEVMEAAFLVYGYINERLDYIVVEIFGVLNVIFGLLLILRLYFAYVIYRVLLSIRILAGLVFLGFAAVALWSGRVNPDQALAFTPWLISFSAGVLMFFLLRRQPVRQWFAA